jgi:hypothetical protein
MKRINPFYMRLTTSRLHKRHLANQLCENNFSFGILSHMGLLDGLKKAVGTAAVQLTSSSPKPQGIYFTPNFQTRAKQWHVSEADALDVYHHGEERASGKKVRKYNGYELGICYGHNTNTGGVYISTIWKRERR